jgi:hypothetical protein
VLAYEGNEAMPVLIPISWGELIDKVTILEIKSTRLTSPAALENVLHELQLLSSIVDEVKDPSGQLQALKAALKQLNERLWNIENEIREKESRKIFDQEFVELARSIYRTNDHRGLLKRKINLLLHSDLIEEKEYASY